MCYNWFCENMAYLLNKLFHNLFDSLPYRSRPPQASFQIDALRVASDWLMSGNSIGQERHLASINMKTSLISGISKVKHYLCICTTIDRVVASDHGGFYMSKFVSILVSKNRININLNALVNISSNIFALPFQEKKYIFCYPQHVTWVTWRYCHTIIPVIIPEGTGKLHFLLRYIKNFLKNLLKYFWVNISLPLPHL